MKNICRILLMLLIVLSSGCINLDDPENPFNNKNIGVVTEGKTINDFDINNSEGKTDTLEVKIGDEHFYVIGYEDNNVLLLAKYNLLVGKVVDKDSNEEKKNFDSMGKGTGDRIPFYGKYGLQSKKALGLSDSNNSVGVVRFSAMLNPDTVFPFYVDVYNTMSSIIHYFDLYKFHLETGYNISIKEIRLIKYEELESLRCYLDFTCLSAPSWVIQMSYWTGTATSTNYFKTVNYFGSIETSSAYVDKYGVRPVIVVSKDLF